MDFIKSQFDRIQQQLSGLTPSQKMLTGALVVIMVMTLVWWGRYAGQPEMEPLLSQALADEDLTRITSQLDARGIPYEVSNDKKLLVSADHKIKVLAALGYADLLPKDTTNGFDEIIKQMTPWDGQDRQNLMFNRGKEITLREVIRHFPDVVDATVAIDPTRERNIGGANIEPTAFVNIRMKTGAKPNKQLVKGAASVVAGSQAGLAMKNVKVVVDGVPQHVREEDPENTGADDIFELRLREEAWLTQKVAGQFPDIQGLMVAVTVEVEHRSVIKVKDTVDKVEAKESEQSTSSKESSVPAPPAGEPGAGPNIGGPGIGTPGSGAAVASIGGGAGGEGAGTQNETEEKTKFLHYPSRSHEETKTPAGAATVVGASVRVPRSYFVRFARGAGTAEPSEAAVQACIKEQVAVMRESVAKCIHLTDKTGITVDPYFDQAPPAPDGPAATTASSMSLAIGGHTKEIVLGALALVSLFLVSTIVKKASPVPVAVAKVAEPKLPPPVLEAGEAVAGEAGEGNPLLDGMVLDDDAVKTQQMLAQVSTMVDENPDGAAALVKRWLNRT